MVDSIDRLTIYRDLVSKGGFYRKIGVVTRCIGAGLGKQPC